MVLTTALRGYLKHTNLRIFESIYNGQSIHQRSKLQNGSSKESIEDSQGPDDPSNERIELLEDNEHRNDDNRQEEQIIDGNGDQFALIEQGRHISSEEREDGTDANQEAVISDEDAKGNESTR